MLPDDKVRLIRIAHDITNDAIEKLQADGFSPVDLLTLFSMSFITSMMFLSAYPVTDKDQAKQEIIDESRMSIANIIESAKANGFDLGLPPIELGEGQFVAKVVLNNGEVHNLN